MNKRALGVAFAAIAFTTSAFAQDWDRGERLPPEFRSDRFVFNDWRDAHLAPPPRGAHWAFVHGSYFLVARNGVILDIAEGHDRDHDRDFSRDDHRDAAPPPPREAYAPPPGPPGGDDRWNHRYSHQYAAADDPAYQECRNQPDPGGVLAGAVLGGILGNLAGGRNAGGATVAGVVAGGAIGAALTSKMDCNDRSYAYKTYGDGFNAGRANAVYTWRNPQNNDSGEMRVLDYYRDEDNFRCAVFTHDVIIHGRHEEARGRACQQPNGTWTIID